MKTKARHVAYEKRLTVRGFDGRLLSLRTSNPRFARRQVPDDGEECEVSPLTKPHLWLAVS